ncbi:MAG TPA: HEAT repeat domain-containing protein [Opitutaceae bacterium]|jgi:HEAT repeat protein|nr:HEAT repeat domain-containing protein [Opitutaceae bacterium]
MASRPSFRFFICLSLLGLAGCSLLDPIGAAIKKLQDPEAAVRREAINTLSLKHDARAVEPLILCLNDKDAEVRKGAAKALGSIDDPRAIDPLIASLPADDDEFRQAAIAALGKLDNRGAGERLMFDLQKNGPTDATKAALIEALGDLRYAEAVEILTSFLASKSDDISREAIGALARIGTPAVPSLIARLNDPQAQLRASAAEALGQIGDGRAVGPLIACLKHPAPETAENSTGNMPNEKEPTDPKTDEEQAGTQEKDDLQVRQKAAEALGKLGPPAVEPLIACLEEKDPSVRSLAVTALGQLHDSRAIKPLIACLVELSGENTMDEENSEGVNLQQSVFDALANLGQPAIDPLVTYLQDKDVHVRQDAAEVLFRLHYLPSDNDGKAAFFILRKSWDDLVKLGAPAVAPLLNSLKDEDGDVRKGAAEALGQLNDKRAVEPLIACLQDDFGSVKQNAATALGLLGDKRAVDPLINLFKSESEDVRLAAAEALGLLGDGRAIAPLAAGLKDEPADLRLTCAQALEKLHYQPDKAEDNALYLIALESWDKVVKLGPPAFDPLVACLSDSSREVRESAIGALGNLGDKRAIAPLREALPDWNFNATLVSALEQLGWKPASEEEQIYAWIGKKDTAHLKEQWEKTRQVLLGDVSSTNHQKMENAVYSFMAMGDPKVVDDLVQVLDEQGDKDIAETYLNCGNDRLEQAARDWASKNGYQTMMLPAGSTPMHWGSW